MPSNPTPSLEGSEGTVVTDKETLAAVQRRLWWHVNNGLAIEIDVSKESGGNPWQEEQLQSDLRVFLKEFDSMRIALAQLEADKARLEEQVSMLSKPSYFYDADCWEFTTKELDNLTDSMGGGDVMEIGRLVSLPNRFLARVPTLDDDGDAIDLHLQWFDTEADAKAAMSPPSQPQGEPS